MKLKDRLREAMDARGVNQTELSRRAKVSQPTISDILSGEQEESRKLPQLARAFLCPAF